VIANRHDALGRRRSTARSSAAPPLHRARAERAAFGPRRARPVKAREDHPLAGPAVPPRDGGLAVRVCCAAAPRSSQRPMLIRNRWHPQDAVLRNMRTEAIRAPLKFAASARGPWKRPSSVRFIK